MIYSILVFLDAAPLTVFTGAPDDNAEWSHFFEDIFASFMAYLVADDERIRTLANTVSRKIMTEGSMDLWRTNQHFGARSFKINFWRST